MDEQAAPDPVREAERAVVEAALTYATARNSWAECGAAKDLRASVENLAALRAPKTCEPPAGSNWRWHWLACVETGLQFPYEWSGGRWHQYGISTFPQELATAGYVYHSECRPSEPKVEPTDEAIKAFLNVRPFPPGWFSADFMLVRAVLAHFSPIAKPAAELTISENEMVDLWASVPEATHRSGFSYPRLVAYTHAIINRVAA